MVRAATLTSVLVVLSSVLLGCADPAPDVASTPDVVQPPINLRLTFDDSVGAEGSLIPAVDNAGTAPVSIEVVTLSGGRLLRERGPDGDAGRFPALSRGVVPQATALVVHSEGVNDALSPGVRDFDFGADFRLDAVTDGVPSDNGDNLVQRGLFVDTAQYKLQLDHGVASCRVAGVDGVLVVSADAPVEPDRWYRVACSRRGDVVELSLSEATGGVWASPRRWRVTGPTGLLRVVPGIPLTVGAKTFAGGEIVRGGADQFNGAVDNVVYELH